jgi:hypothetical protein
MTLIDNRALLLAVRSRVFAVSSALLASLLGCGATAHAQSAVTTQDPIALELNSEAHSARRWRYIWTGLNGGAAIISVAAIPILPKSDRPDLVVGAATAALSGAFTWFWPLDVEEDAEQAELSRDWAPEARRVELLRLRRHSAEDEAERVRWPWHVGNFVTALIPGAILWFGFKEHLNGALSAAGSFASGEIELLTQPTHLADQPPATGVGTIRPTLLLGGALLTYRQSW